MANINSLTSNSYSSSSSIYGNRNVLTGLASGMDTEAMIENSVTGYQTKIAELQQKQTKLEWKQDAYRELTDQMYSITSKYTSFASETNLSSNAFFTNNVSTTVNGGNASAVTASGKATSDIRINAVDQLATAARYTVDSSALDINVKNEAVGDAINWGESLTKGTLSGTMTLKAGSSTIELKFTDEDKYASLNELVDGINKKLDDQSADVKATLKNGEITFETTGSAKTRGDSVYISGASGNLKTMLDVTTATSSADEKRFEYKSFSLKGDASGLTKTMSMAEYLSGKTVNVTLDGVSKSIKIGDLGNDATTEDLKNDLQKSVDKEFGSGKVTVGLTDTKWAYDDSGNPATFSKGLTFDVAEGSGSTLKVTSSVGKELGIGEAGVSNYFNTSQKLSDLVGEDWLKANARTEATLDSNAAERYFDKDGNELKLSDGKFYRTNGNGGFLYKNGEKVSGTWAYSLKSDTDGNLIKADGDKYYRVNNKGEWAYSLQIGGASIDGITGDTTMEGILNKINSSNTAGVKVSYSNLTGQFVFTSQQTGAGSEVSFEGALAQKLFGVSDGKKLGSVFSGVNWSEDAVKIGGVSLTGTSALSAESTVEDLRELINNAGFSFRIEREERTGAYSFVSTSTGKTLEEFDRSLLIGEKSYKLTDIFKADTGAAYTKGEDAVIRATVNGKDIQLNRSSNVIDMDGLSVTLKEEFSAYGDDGKLKAADALTFSTSSNSDKIVDAVKTFVEDVNKLMSDVHKAFTTQPITKTSNSSSKGVTYYEPLTEEDRNGMSESAIEKYEEKAKTGLLFGDSDLRSLYDKLLTAVQSFGADRTDLESIGLTTAYSGGVTTFKLNETKLREALDGDPDKVRNIFTKTTEGGSATNGLMASLKMTLNDYASTSLASPGVLVRKAGTKLSAVSLLNNNIYQQISNLDKQIESWQTKLSSRVDYYTKQFTALEKMMSTMNNQSSMLADLMGY